VEALLILGQRLYESNELVERGVESASEPPLQVLDELLKAKWTDPVLGCMAYYAWDDAMRRRLPAAEGAAPTYSKATARNLLAYFGDLPDARVIGAMAVLPEPRRWRTRSAPARCPCSRAVSAWPPTPVALGRSHFSVGPPTSLRKALGA
jgi:hypothetical protein